MNGYGFIIITVLGICYMLPWTWVIRAKDQAEMREALRMVAAATLIALLLIWMAWAMRITAKPGKQPTPAELPEREGC